MNLPVSHSGLAVIAMLIAVSFASAANQSWDGSSTSNGNWSNPINWISDTAPPGSTVLTSSTDVASFSGTIANSWGSSALNPVVIDSVTQNVAGITFTSTAGNYFIGSTSGNPLRLSSGGTIQISSGLLSTNAVETVNSPLVLQGTSYSLVNNSANGSGTGAGTLVIGGDISGTTGTTTLTLNGSNTNANAISGSISNGMAGSVRITKSGSGTWVLTSANSYTGITTVSQGVLRIMDGHALGSTATGTTVASGAALQIQGGIKTAAEPLTLTGPGAGVAAFTGALRSMSGDNNYAGLIAISGGARINSDSGTLTLSHTGTIGGSGGLTVGGAGNTTIESVIGSSHTLTKDGTGALTLKAANTYSGNTFVNQGVLNLQNGNALGGSTVTVESGAALELEGGFTTPVRSLTLKGTGVNNTGALRNISGNNNYAGLVSYQIATRINSDAGTLTLSHTGTISGFGTALTVGGNGNITIQSVLGSNVSSLTKDGSGTLTLTRSNASTGNTTVNDGVLNLAFGTVSANIIHSSSALRLGGAALHLTGTGTQSVNGLTILSGDNQIVLASPNQTLTAGAISAIPTNSALNVNTAAGGADAGTSSVGTSALVVAGMTPGSAYNPAFTISDSTGFGLATVNGSNQVVRLTTTALLPAAGASSSMSYRVDNNTGGPAASGSSSLTMTSTSSVTSLTVDTTAVSGSLNLNPGVTLNNNTYNFGGVGSNSYQITGSASGAGLRSQFGDQTLSFNNYNAGTITIAAPILANGANSVNVNGTGTTVFSGANTFTGAVTVNGGTLEITNSDAFGFVGSGVTVNAGASLRLNNVAYTAPEAMSLNGTGIANGGALVNSGTSSYAGTITAATNASIHAGGGTLTLSGGLVKNGTTLTIMGSGRINITTTGISGANPNSDLIIDNATVLTSVASTYNGPTTVQNNATLVANNPSGSATGTGTVTVDATSTLSGTGRLDAGSNNYLYLNGALIVGDSTLGVPVASSLTLASSGAGSTVLGVGSSLHFDLFGGAGLGDNTSIAAAADYIRLFGTMDFALGGTLIISNPSASNGFTIGDEWRLFDLANGNLSSIPSLDYSALGLPGNLAGSFNSSTGVFSIVAAVPEPSRALLLLAGTFTCVLRRRRGAAGVGAV